MGCTEQVVESRILLGDLSLVLVVATQGERAGHSQMWGVEHRGTVQTAGSYECHQHVSDRRM